MAENRQRNYLSFSHAAPVAGNYVPYRDRVVAGNGAIGNVTATQAALDALDALPTIVQWLDSRHGLGPQWFSICGPQADAHYTGQGTPTLGNDTSLANTLTLAGGGWNGGRTPELGPTDDYTWGLKLRVGAQEGYEVLLWGDRYGGNYAWTWLSTTNWRSYNQGNDRDIPFALPRAQWLWVWVVKQGNQVTGYLDDGTILFQTTLSAPIGELGLGIAGSTDAYSVLSHNSRYQTFIRAASALSASERAAIQAI